MTEHDDLISRLARFGKDALDPTRQSRDLTAMAGVRATSRLRPKLRLAGAFIAGLLLGGSGLAAADALPDSAQHVAHKAFHQVGIHVPDPERYHDAEVCGPDEKRNHGAYVRDDHNLAKSDCGKKLKAAEASDPGDDGPTPREAEKSEKAERSEKADEGPCEGKPPWAGNQDFSAEDKAQEQAKRAEICGTDEDDASEVTVP